jgi:membrane protein
MLVGGDLGQLLAQRFGLRAVYQIAWSFLRWPVTAFIVMLATSFAYYVLPDVEQEFRFITPGSLVGTIVWLCSSWGFTQYVEHFGQYNLTYGSIGGVIILLSWFYLSAVILILGGELNALLEDASQSGKPRGARAAGEAPLPPSERPHAATT